MTLIILPVRNEASMIQNTISTLLKWCKGNLSDFEILFIDDGSTDDTFQIIRKNTKVKVYKNVFERGKGSALKVGCVYSTFLYAAKDDDNIIFMDGDGQIEPQEINTMLNIMTFYNSDVVIANKRHIYSNIFYTKAREIVSKSYNLLVRFLFDLRHEDTQCGLKIFKKKVLDDVISKVSIKRFAFDLELIVALRQMGYRVADSPVKIKKQLNQGSVSIQNIIRTFIDTLIIWYKYKKGFYAHDILRSADSR